MKMSLKVLSLSLCLALAGAMAFAGSSCGSKASGESLGGGADKSSCAMKSGESLGGGAEKASCPETADCPKEKCEALGGGAEKSSCPMKSGESLGGGAEKASCPVTGAAKIGEALGGGVEKTAADKAACATACASKSGESLGGSAEKTAADKAACENMTAEQKAACAAACAAKSGESLGGSAEKTAADKAACANMTAEQKAACAAACAAKSGESLGGSTEKAAAGELKPCCAGCADKIAKGEKPECCVKASLGGGAETKDATAMKADGDHSGHDHSKMEKKEAKKDAEALGGSAEAGEGAYKVGQKIADLSLIDVKTGAETTLSSKAGSKATVLIFWNQECPFVVDVQNRVNEFHKTYSAQGVNVVALDGGNNNSIDSIKAYHEKFAFPVLANPDTKIASKFGATRTPEVFILDSGMNILYHGAFDSGTVQGGDKPESTFVINFVDNMLAGKANDVTQTKPFGCSLKYAKGVTAMK